jgi:hypothetical protein
VAPRFHRTGNVAWWLAAAAVLTLVVIVWHHLA